MIEQRPRGRLLDRRPHKQQLGDLTVVNDRATLPAAGRDAALSRTATGQTAVMSCPYCGAVTVESEHVDPITGLSRCMGCTTLLPRMSPALAQRLANAGSIVEANRLDRTTVIAYWTIETGIGAFGIALLLTLLSVGNISQYSINIILCITLLGMLIGGVWSYIRAHAVARPLRLFAGSAIAAVMTYIALQVVFFAAHDAIASITASNPRLTPERITVALVALATSFPGSWIGSWLRGR